MIIAIEGPDGSGKTTLWNSLRQIKELQKFRFVNFCCDRELYEQARAVEQRDIRIFRAVYDPGETYITDRFFSVSGPVYSKVFGRMFLSEYYEWAPLTAVIYLRLNFADLYSRAKDRGEDFLGKLLEIHHAYGEILTMLPYSLVVSLDADLSIQPLTERLQPIIEVVSGWKKELPN